MTSPDAVTRSPVLGPFQRPVAVIAAAENSGTLRGLVKQVGAGLRLLLTASFGSLFPAQFLQPFRFFGLARFGILGAAQTVGFGPRRR